MVKASNGKSVRALALAGAMAVALSVAPAWTSRALAAEGEEGLATASEGQAAPATTGDSLAYVDKDGVERFVDLAECRRLHDDDKQSTFRLGRGWYYATGEEFINARLNVEGDVNLVLPDDAKLTVKFGIHVCNGCSITIYGQRGGSGVLDVTHALSGAGIGGNDGESGSNITICGGRIFAKGGTCGAAIGAGQGADADTIEIYGGEVHATSTERGAAIGGGERGAGGCVTIYGGKVFAHSSDGEEEGTYGYYCGAAIGGGSSASGGIVKILGGEVDAHSHGNAAAIGGGGDWGHGSDGGQVTIAGARVTAYCEGSAAAIGGGPRAKGGRLSIGDDAYVNAKSELGFAIGCGLDGTDRGELELGDHLAVSPGNIDDMVAAAYREEFCFTRRHVEVSACEHRNAVFEGLNEEKLIFCKNCKATSEL